MSYAFNLTKPDRLVKLVNVNLNGDNPSLKFSSAWSCISVEGSFEVFYRGRSNDTLITYKSREKKMENQEFIDVLITDLELLLNEVSDKLDEFNVTFCWCGVEQEDLAHLQDVYDQLTPMTRHKKINACSVGLAVNDIDQVRIAYTCCDLQTLRHCAFHFVDNQFKDPANAFKTICEIDELKFLDSFEAHFKVENLSIDGLIAIKQVVMNSGRKCKAVIDNTNKNNLQNEELTNIFEGSIEKYQEWIICRCENLKCYIYESRIEIQRKEWKSTSREKYMRKRTMGLQCSEDSEDEDDKLWRESMNIPKRETRNRHWSDFKHDSSTHGTSPENGQPSTTEDMRRDWENNPQHDMMLELVITQLLDSENEASTGHSNNSESNINDNMLETKRSLLFSKDNSSKTGAMAKMLKSKFMQLLLDPENDSSPDSECSVERFDNRMLEAAIKQSLIDMECDSSTDGTRPEDNLLSTSDNTTPTSRKRSESSEENSDNITLQLAIELSLLASKNDSAKVEEIAKKLKLQRAKLKLRIMRSLSDLQDDSLSDEANLQNVLASTSDNKNPTSRKRTQSSESNISNIMRKLEIEQSLLDSKNDSSTVEAKIKMLKINVAKNKLVFVQSLIDAASNSLSDGAILQKDLHSASDDKPPTSRKHLERSVESLNNTMFEASIEQSLLDSKGDSATDETRPGDVPSLNSEGRHPTSRKRSENSESNIENIMMKLAIKQSLLNSKGDSSTDGAMANMLELAIAQSLLDSDDDSSTDGVIPQGDSSLNSEDKAPTSRKRLENSESNIENIMMKLAINQSILDSKDNSSIDRASPEGNLPLSSDNKTATSWKGTESSEENSDNIMLKYAVELSLLDSKKHSSFDEASLNDDLPSTFDNKSPTSRKHSASSESEIDNMMKKLAIKQSFLDSKDDSSTDGASSEDELPSTTKKRSSRLQRQSEVLEQSFLKVQSLIMCSAVQSAFDSKENTSNTEAVAENNPESEVAWRQKRSESFQNLMLTFNNMMRQSGLFQNSSDSESDSSDDSSKKEQTGSSHRALTNQVIMSLILQRVGLKTSSTLRQVSWGIRRCVDGIKSDPKVEAIAISFDTTDRVKIEVTDKTIHKIHVFQTVYNDSYKKFWNDEQSMNMNDEYTYPSYELYHFPSDRLERGHYYPLATVFSKSSKQNVIEWYQKRLCSFSYELRHTLLNQRKPIESFSIRLPWFIMERGDPEFLFAGYHFISMFGHEVPMYTKFLDLKIKSRACEHCQKTDEVRNLASCDVHQRMFRELLEENREICGPDSGHPDYQNRPITYTQDEYVQRVDLFVKYFEDILSSVGHKIPVEALYMQACNQNSVLRVLRHLDSRSLKTISIKIVEDDQDKPCNWILPMEINEICELDQWKCAKNIEVEHLIDTDDVRHFGHFSGANLKLTRLTMAGILILKTTFLRSQNFIKFKASFETSDINANIYEADMLGWSFNPNTDNPSVWYFKFLHSSDYLHVLYYASRRRIMFTRREEESVPANIRA